MGAGGSRNYVATYLSLRRDALIATSRRTDCYVVTHQMLRRDVISGTSASGAAYQGRGNR